MEFRDGGGGSCIGECLAGDGLSRCWAGISECLARGWSAKMGRWHW